MSPRQGQVALTIALVGATSAFTVICLAPGEPGAEQPCLTAPSSTGGQTFTRTILTGI